MNEEERAGWLARAVDKLIHHQPADGPPEDLNCQDADLLQIAKARLDLSDVAAHQSLQHEDSVWQKLLGRLGIPEAPVLSPVPVDPLSFPPHSADEAAGLDLSAQERQELKEVAALRYDMSARMMALAEIHREAVWQEVHARLSTGSSSKGLLGFFRRVPRHAGVASSPLDGFAAGQTLWQSTESHTDELIELARKRRVIGLMARQASSRAERRIWSRVFETVRGEHRVAVPLRVRPRLGWQRLAVGGALLALVVAAVGPIPSTGLAGHPFARFVETVGDHVGVSESGPPPVDAGAPTVIEGTRVTAGEASDLLGIEVSESVEMPAGYHLTASLHYAAGLTGSGGTFLRSYISGSTAILLFQEAAPDTDLAVAEESATRDVTLADGTPATVFHGGWIPGSSGFSWTNAGAQTLVFDKDGLRTIIQFIGDDAVAPDLTAIASGLR